MFGEILALAILTGDVWAMVDISQRAPSPGAKIIWIVVILLLPVWDWPSGSCLDRGGYGIDPLPAGRKGRG